MSAATALRRDSRLQRSLQYVSSDSSTCGPSTPATSDAETPFFSSIDHAEIYSQDTAPSARRRSMSFGTVSTDFTSLLRSYSINSARRRSPLLEVDEFDKESFSEHDHSLSKYPTVNMLEAPLDRQSSTKRTKSRFYSMFNRSARSRSNSRSDPPPAYESPDGHHTLPIEQANPPTTSADKSHSRPKLPSQSHSHGAPILPTTTNVLVSGSASPPESTVASGPSSSSPRPTTPKSRTKISHIFGKISSPKKTSRPTSPAEFHDPGPSISLTYRAQSPTMTLEMQASATGTSRHPLFRTSRRSSMEASSPYATGDNGAGPHSYHDLPRYPSLSDDTADHPLARNLSRRSSRGKSAAGSTEHVVYSPSPQKIPQIIHTPPTPQRPSTSPGRLHQRKNSTGSQHPTPQPPTLKTVTEERQSMLDSSPVETPRSEKGKEKDVFQGFPSSHQAQPHGALHRKAGTTGAVKERKHGSFNFEKPSRASASQDGPLTRLLSSSASPGEASTSSQRHRSLKPPPTPPDVHPTVSASSSQQSHSQTHSHSTHRTNHTSSTGQRQSSWGRMFGRKAKPKAVTTSQPKALRATQGLGQFDFEPAVPSPRSYAFSREDAEEVAGRLRAAQRQRDKDRARAKEKERERELERERQLLAQARRAVEASQQVSSSLSSDRPVGFRSGNKGKSLDLGLGLAWAPTKVREDALLPSFSRSGSSPSRNGYRNSRERDVLYVDEHGALRHRSPDGSKVGRDVAEVFKQALVEVDYLLFKKYVHRFDAHEIPFDGPTGIVSRVEKLLEHAPALSDAGKRDLLDSFIRVVLQNA